MKTCTACAGTGHPPLIDKRDYSQLCTTCGGSGQIQVKESKSPSQRDRGGCILVLMA